MESSDWLAVALFAAPFLLSGSILWWLSKYYVSKPEWQRECARCAEDVNRIGGKMNRIRESVQSNKDMVQEALTRVSQVQSDVARQHEHIEKHLIVPIRELAAKMEALQLQFATQAATAKFVEQTVSEIKEWIEEDHRADRNNSRD